MEKAGNTKNSFFVSSEYLAMFSANKLFLLLPQLSPFVQNDNIRPLP